MAGDWIKFELTTLDKPEVCQIADLADIDSDAVVGKLLRVWGWFDQQTEAGNAPSVSKRLLDRLVGVTSFCEHMKAVGWMVEEEGVISLPHFDRHNGKTAKNRLLTAKRVANHKASSGKGSGKSNAVIVSDALPKEDVEKNKSKEQEQRAGAASASPIHSVEQATPSDQPSSKARASRLAQDWTLPADWREWAIAERPDLTADIGRIAETFRDYWHAKSGKDATKASWLATWRNWIRNQKAAGVVHQFPGASRHAGFDQRDYSAGLIEREDGTNGF